MLRTRPGKSKHSSAFWQAAEAPSTPPRPQNVKSPRTGILGLNPRPFAAAAQLWTGTPMITQKSAPTHSPASPTYARTGPAAPVSAVLDRPCVRCGIHAACLCTAICGSCPRCCFPGPRRTGFLSSKLVCNQCGRVYPVTDSSHPSVCPTCLGDPLGDDVRQDPHAILALACLECALPDF